MDLLSISHRLKLKRKAHGLASPNVFLRSGDFLIPLVVLSRAKSALEMNLGQNSLQAIVIIFQEQIHHPASLDQPIPIGVAKLVNFP